MDKLIKLIELYAIQRVMGPYAPLNSTTKAKLALSITMGLFALVGALFFLTGLYQWLHSEFPPSEATMMFGGVLILIATIAAVTNVYLQSVKRKKMNEFKEEIKKDVTELLYAFDDAISENNPIKNHPTTSVIVSALAGYATGETGKKAANNC